MEFLEMRKKMGLEELESCMCQRGGSFVFCMAACRVVPFAGCWDILGVVRHRRMQEGAVVRQPILCHARDSAALPWQADGTYQLCKPN